MNKIIRVGTILTILVIPSIAQGKFLETFVCSGQRINMSDTTYSVIKKCGEPAYKEIISAEGCEKVEMWHYDCKGRGYIDMLKFKSGVLIDRFRGERSSGVQQCQ